MNIPVKIATEQNRKHQKNFFDEVKAEMLCKYCGAELRINELNDNTCSDCMYYHEK